MESDQQIDVYLVCNARYHDTNFARLELLKLLAENENINTTTPIRLMGRIAHDIHVVSNRKSRTAGTFSCQS